MSGLSPITTYSYGLLRGPLYQNQKLFPIDFAIPSLEFSTSKILGNFSNISAAFLYVFDIKIVDNVGNSPKIDRIAVPLNSSE